MFLKLVETSSQVKEAKLSFVLLNNVVLELGLETVAQVVIHNATKCVQLGEMLVEKHCSILWTPCAVHYMDLLLEDIGKLDWVKSVVDQTKAITIFLYSHACVLNLVSKNIRDTELVWPTITRFAMIFLALLYLIS
jgi:hypothetical protein